MGCQECLIGPGASVSFGGAEQTKFVCCSNRSLAFSNHDEGSAVVSTLGRRLLQSEEGKIGRSVTRLFDMSKRGKESSTAKEALVDGKMDKRVGFTDRWSD